MRSCIDRDVEVSFLESCHVLAILQAWDRFHLFRHGPLPISFRFFFARRLMFSKQSLDYRLLSEVNSNTEK
jgi:hypothetical protein